MMNWLRWHVHPTWHMTVLCAGVLIGVIYGGTQSEALHGIHVGVACIAITIACWKRWRVMLALSLCAGLLIGGWRGSLVHVELSTYRALYGKSMTLVGVVDGDPEERKMGDVVLKARDISLDTASLAGTIWVTTNTNTMPKRGDYVRVHGVLTEGFGTFAATMYSAELINIKRMVGGDPALVVRDQFSSHVKQAIDDPASSLGVGYLLGQKQALPNQLQEALVVTGLTHVVVASGYNLTILVRLARRLFASVSKYSAALVSVSLVLCFVAVTGASASMVRAGLVALLGVWAWYYGRKFHPVTLLLFVAAVTVLWNPSYIWGDVGWALSFMAFAGVMILAPLMHAYFYGEQKASAIGQILGETISAQVATAPIILLVFGQFSNIAVLANLLILPFIPLAMLLTFGAGLGAWIAPSFAVFVGWPAQVILDAMVWVINWAAEIPGAQSAVKFEWWGLVVWYAVVAGVCMYMKWRTGYRLREASIVE